ncbi:MAG: hypothetical protein ACI8XM_002129 [Haloarculaceae archaeon]|jgi:hypothetical protein
MLEALLPVAWLSGTMTDQLPDGVERAVEGRDAFERDGDGFRVTTTAFDGRVTALEGPDATVYTVTVRVPTLDAATADGVGGAVEDGWFETLERRLEDAPKATRADVELANYDVERDGEEVFVTYGFEWEGPGRAADIAKTFVEYVEGTYVEGIVPGYEYVSPVADLIDSASQGEGGSGGMPL